MNALKNLSIKKKLTALVMLVVAAGMALSCTAIVLNDVRLMRSDMVRQLSALADVLGANSAAALTFDDDAAAAQVLSSLRMQPLVTSAVLVDAEGNVFATYPEDASMKARAPEDEERDHRGIAEVSSKIRHNNETVGAIYIRGNLDIIRQELLHYGMIVGSVMLASITASYLLASRLQRLVSGPILRLARAAEQVSREGDYSIRVQKPGNDELGVLYDEFNRMLSQVETSKRALEEAHSQLEARVDERTQQLSDANKELSKEVAERRRAEKELERAHQELVASARRAGMAEIATGVLHNVGNVLNSVNVSSELMSNRLRASKRSQLSRVVALLDEHADDVGGFLTNDDKGKQVPGFLKALAERLESEEGLMLEECQSLLNNIEHIKKVISTQQSYAGGGGLIEPVEVNELLDDAVRLNSSSFERHAIRVEREYAEIPTLLADKQRLLQIVVNLVKNAKEALLEQNEHERMLSLRTSVKNDRLEVEVGDTGVGIRREDMTRVFSHGFTTKASGHGFGLHSCANSATEMNGSLSAHSDGPMQGAVFTLNLPLVHASAPAQSV